MTLLRSDLDYDERSILSASIDECGSLVLTPVSRDPIERFRRAGRCFFAGVDIDAYINELRDE